jgi:hypothetical protein
MTDMEELRMNQNKLSGLPPDLARLTRLRDLQVSDSFLFAYVRMILAAQADRSHLFQVAYNELASLPRTLGLNTSLTRLKVWFDLHAIYSSPYAPHYVLPMWDPLRDRGAMAAGCLILETGTETGHLD